MRADRINLCIINLNVLLNHQSRNAYVHLSTLLYDLQPNSILETVTQWRSRMPFIVDVNIRPTKQSNGRRGSACEWRVLEGLVGSGSDSHSHICFCVSVHTVCRFVGSAGHHWKAIVTHCSSENNCNICCCTMRSFGQTRFCNTILFENEIDKSFPQFYKKVLFYCFCNFFKS